MKVATLAVLVAMGALGADKKVFPGQAGNNNIELTGALIIDPAEIRQAVGSDLGPGIILARVKATNKTGEGMRISPANFALVSRKDGDRSDALSAIPGNRFAQELNGAVRAASRTGCPSLSCS